MSAGHNRQPHRRASKAKLWTAFVGIILGVAALISSDWWLPIVRGERDLAGRRVYHSL